MARHRRAASTQPRQPVRGRWERTARPKRFAPTDSKGERKNARTFSRPGVFSFPLIPRPGDHRTGRRASTVEQRLHGFHGFHGSLRVASAFPFAREAIAVMTLGHAG